ncbi:MAG: carboxyl transferase domain-containing protein, partial [Bauldia litoralis]
MRRIESQIDTNAADFKANFAAMSERLKEFHARQHAARYERPQRDIERLARQNKLGVRDRLELLLDPGTPFLEFSTLAACREYDGSVPGAAVVTGIGIVQGREVAIHANDASVKGGAWYPHTVKKVVRLLDVALENRLPVIHICDSAGGFLPLQHGVFPDRYLGGRVFRNQVKLSQANIPQIAVVGGHCTAGGAYVPTLSDYNIIIEGTGAIFLGGPPLVKAATGEEVGVQELGGAVMHTSVSGTGDYRAATEQHAFSLAREIVGQWKRMPKTIIETAAFEEPYYDPKELYGIIPKDRKTQFDMREVLARIVDGSRFHEYQPDYGTTMV